MPIRKPLVGFTQPHATLQERTGWSTPLGRPFYRDEQGNEYAEKTLTFQTKDKKWVAFPSVGANGDVLPQSALEEYVNRQGPIDPLTKETFPTFDTVEEANNFAAERSKRLLPKKFEETLESVFRLENDGVALLQILTSKRYDPDPTFRLRDYIDESTQRYFDSYPEAFVGVRSKEQLAAKIAEIQQEEKDSAVRTAAGVPGAVAGLLAGILSPVTAIPLIGPGAKGLAAVRQGAALGAVAGGLQSGALYAAQATRRNEDLALDISAGAVVGAILGPAAGHLSAMQRARIDSDMARGTVPEAIPQHLLSPPSVRTNADEAFVNPEPRTIVAGDFNSNMTVTDKIESVFRDNKAAFSEANKQFLHRWENNVQMSGDTPRTAALGIVRQRAPLYERGSSVLEEVASTWSTQIEAAAWLAKNATRPHYRALAARLHNYLPEHGLFLSVDRGSVLPKAHAERFNTRGDEALGLNYANFINDFARGEHMPAPYTYIWKGQDEEVILHELIHAAMDNRLGRAMKYIEDAKLGVDRRYKVHEDDLAFYNELEEFRVKLSRAVGGNLNFGGDIVTASGRRFSIAEGRGASFAADVRETLTYGLTNSEFSELLKTIPFDKPDRNFWDVFLDILRRAFGLTDTPETYTALEDLIRVFTKHTDPRRAGELKNFRTRATTESSEWISRATASLSSAATAPFEDPGRLKGIKGTNFAVDAPSWLFGPISRSPVVQTIQQQVSPAARSLMAKLSTAGLRLQGNAFGRVSAAGGTIENLVQRWYSKVDLATRAIDDSYQKYMYGENPPKLAKHLRAVVAGIMSADKMSKHEFKSEIARAMRNGDEYTGPAEAVEAANEIKKFIYDPMTKEALEVGLLKQEDIDNVIGDVSYLNRMYDLNRITANKGKFIDLLAKHFRSEMEAKFAKAIENLKNREDTDKELLDVMKLNVKDVNAMRDYYLRALKEIQKRPVQSQADLIAEKKAAFAEAKQQRDTVEMVDGVPVYKSGPDLDKMRQEIRDLTEAGGEALAQHEAEKATFRRNLRNLNKAVSLVSERYQAKLGKAERIEELQIRTLERLVRKIELIRNQTNKLTDEALIAKVASIRNSFESTLRSLEKYETRLKGLMDSGDPSDPLNLAMKIDEAIENRFARLNELAERLDDQEALASGAEGLRGIVDEMATEALRHTNDINSKRALRAERLREQALKLDPKIAEQRFAELQKKQDERRLDFRERWRVAGADDVDIDKGSANWNQYSDDLARTVTDKILGTYIRLPGMDILQDLRGPELARVLNIPSHLIEEFLHNDIEFLMRSYVRTMGSDIEFMRKFGATRPEAELEKIVREFEEAQRAVDAEVGKIGVKGVEAKKKALGAELKMTMLNVEAVMGRLRHTWGIPDNPTGAAARLFRVFQNINVLRFMGTTTVSSIPDLARPIMRYGLQNTMRSGFIPLIKNFKEFKLSAMEAKLAGVANDVTLHSRAYQIADLLDDFGSTSKFERGIEFATSRMGLIALFDYWNAGMKMFSSAVINAELLNAMRVMHSLDETGTELTKATEFLASTGFTKEHIANIWALVSKTEGGGKTPNGVWLPNTESWLNPAVYKAAGLTEGQAKEAQRVYYAALAGEINATIITPGVDRPLWMNGKSLGLRAVAQFRSFAFTSSQKSMMAGLQQADMAVFNGMAFSLALGMFSYYLWAVSNGPDSKAYKEMMSAGFDKWTDEAIQRSGLLAIFGEAQRIGEKIPATADLVSFSGRQSTRSGGDDLTEAVLGPSVDLVSKLAQITTQLHDPTQSTLHTARTLMPYQNLFWARYIFDKVEKSTGQALGLRARRRKK